MTSIVFTIQFYICYQDNIIPNVSLFFIYRINITHESQQVPPYSGDEFSIPSKHSSFAAITTPKNGKSFIFKKAMKNFGGLV